MNKHDPNKLKKHSHSLEKKIQRQNAIDQGAYDGRFSIKVIPDKKKKQDKEAARKWRFLYLCHISSCNV